MTIVKDLMDKHSQATAGRPPIYAADLVCGGMNMGLATYSLYFPTCPNRPYLTWGVAEDWRAFRRVTHEMLTQHACTKHLAIQRAESAQVLHDCLVDPKVWDLFSNSFTRDMA
jgi:hypothetical protein